MKYKVVHSISDNRVNIEITDSIKVTVCVLMSNSGGGGLQCSDIGLCIASYDLKATPANADRFVLSDSADANAPKRISWANIVTALTTVFNALYVAVTDLFLTNRNRGFYDPTDANVILTYDAVNRRITMTGADVRATYQGQLVTETDPTFIAGWVSPQHDVLDVTYYLSFNGTDIAWRTVFEIYDVLIAIKPEGSPFCLRECHDRGMSVETHRHNHFGIGTVFQSGGETSNVVLSSFTAAERRPYTAASSLLDEGLRTVLPALNTNSYTRQYLSGADVVNYDLAQTDIVEVGANNRPYYYDGSSGTYTKTLIPRITTGAAGNRPRYMSIWQIAVPVTADADSQQYRYIFAQGQAFSTTLAQEAARNPNEMFLGTFAELNPEYVFFKQFIIRYAPDEGTGDWNIALVQDIRGSKNAPISISTVGVFPTDAQVSISTLYANLLAGTVSQKDVNDIVDAFNYEAHLGNPAASGYLLSSTILGVRSWIPAPSSDTLQTLTDAAPILWDAASGNIAIVTVSVSRQLDNISNAVAGRTYKLIHKQPAGGACQLTFAANYKLPGGVAPTNTSTANAVDVYEFLAESSTILRLTNFIADSK